MLDLLREMRARYHLSLLLITHDFGVVAEMADRVAVMHRGAIVETGPVRQILRDPQHEYTQRLLRAVPGTPYPRASAQHAAEPGGAGGAEGNSVEGSR